MSLSDRYVKIVEWSDEDQCFVGSCPELFYGGCHGQDEQAVFVELCEIVEELAAQTELEAVQAFDDAIASDDEVIPHDQAIRKIEAARR